MVLQSPDPRFVLAAPEASARRKSMRSRFPRIVPTDAMARRRFLAGGLAAVVLTATASTAALAQTSHLQSGQTLAQIATEKGKTRDDLKAYLTSQEKTRLAKAVTDGKLTQAQADQRLADLSSRLDEMIDRTGPAGGPRGMGPRG